MHQARESDAAASCDARRDGRHLAAASGGGGRKRSDAGGKKGLNCRPRALSHAWSRPGKFHSLFETANVAVKCSVQLPTSPICLLAFTFSSPLRAMTRAERGGTSSKSNNQQRRANSARKRSWGQTPDATTRTSD